MNKRKSDLTQGNVLKQLMIFALPILAGQLFQTLYNSVDSIVVGNFVGNDALAAVTASASLAALLSGFFNGLGTGASVIFGQNFGARRYKELSVAIHTTMTFSFILGSVLAIAGIVFTPQLLNMISCPVSVFDQASVYLRIYLVGVLFTSIYNVGAGVLRSVGDSSHPFYYLVLSSVLNILLDILFVSAFRLGVAGVGLATVIAQFVSVVLTVVSMTKMEEGYAFSFRRLTIDPGVLKRVIAFGLPIGLSSSITAISNIYVQKYINGFSPAAIAGIGSAMKIDQFAGMPCNALGMAMATFVAQNVGAGKYKRAFEGVKIVTVLGTVFVLFLCIPIYLNASSLMRIFGPDSDMIMYGTGMLKTIMPFYLLMGLNGIYAGICQGFGYAAEATASSIFGMVAVRQIWLAISLSRNYVIRNIYIGYPLGWFVYSILLALIYLFKIRKNKNFAFTK